MTIRSPDAPADHVDGLLSSFFQKEVPRAWPAVPYPGVAKTRSARPLPAFRSRLALAASVALLVGGTLLLGGAFRAVNQQTAMPGLEQGTAKHESPGGIRSDIFLEQRRDGPTTIKINFEDLPAPR